MSSTFNEWRLATLERRFGLRQVMKSTTLQQWLAANPVLDDTEVLIANEFQKRLLLNAFAWNEQELLLCFIGPLMSLVNFRTDNSNFFAGREFGGVVDGEMISGKPDGLIASGRMEPESPYFCLQEYKKNVDPNGDPFGQCLAAMLVAQELNEHKFPTYGVVVVGNNWTFMVLEGTQYSLSDSFSSMGEDIYHILKMLKSLKEIVVQYTQ